MKTVISCVLILGLFFISHIFIETATVESQGSFNSSARAWAHVIPGKGPATTITFAHNISKIERQGVGYMQVTFAIPLASNEYVVMVTALAGEIGYAHHLDKSKEGFWLTTGGDRPVEFVVFGGN